MVYAIAIDLITKELGKLLDWSESMWGCIARSYYQIPFKYFALYKHNLDIDCSMKMNGHMGFDGMLVDVHHMFPKNTLKNMIHFDVIRIIQFQEFLSWPC